MTSGPMGWLILPGRLLVRPILAPGLAAFAIAIVPALAILALNYLW